MIRRGTFFLSFVFFLSNCYFNPIVQSILVPEPSNQIPNPGLALFLGQPTGPDLSFSGRAQSALGTTSAGNFSQARISVESNSASWRSFFSRNTTVTSTEANGQGQFQLLLEPGSYLLRFRSLTGEEIAQITLRISSDGTNTAISVRSGTVFLSELVLVSLRNRFSTVSSFPVENQGGAVTSPTNPEGSSGSVSTGGSTGPVASTPVFPNVQINSSAGRGIFNNQDSIGFIGNSSETGTYEFRWNAANCFTGTLLSSGGIQAGVPLALFVSAGVASEGNNRVYLCVTSSSSGLTGIGIFDFSIDSIAPVFVVSSPTNGETGVPSSTTIRATFNEPMRSTIGSSVDVFVSGNPVTGTFSFSGNEIIFQPDVGLQQGQSVNVAFKAFTDLAGNLASQVIFSFTTENPPPPPNQVFIEVNGIMLGATGLQVQFEWGGGNSTTILVPDAPGSYLVSASPNTNDSFNFTILAEPAGYSCNFSSGQTGVIIQSQTTANLVCTIN